MPFRNSALLVVTHTSVHLQCNMSAEPVTELSLFYAMDQIDEAKPR